MDIKEIVNYLEYLVSHIEYKIVDNETIETAEDVARLIKREILDVYNSERN